MINYELSFLIAIAAYVYTNILTDVDMIFNWVYNKLDEKIKYRWIFHVIIHCEKCVAGQLSLWVFLFYHYKDYSKLTVDTLLLHIFFITFTILSTIFIKFLHKQTQKHE